MELTTILLIALVLVLLVIGFKFAKKVASMVATFAGIGVAVYLLILGMQFMDEHNVRNNFLGQNNLFLLEDNGEIITGFATKNSPSSSIGSLENQDNLNSIVSKIDNPNSEIYDEFYKVILVEKDSLPISSIEVIDKSGDSKRNSEFISYVRSNILEGDVAENLIESEKSGSLSVHKETLAFKHGLEILHS